MKRTLTIKNMVCNRCKASVRDLLITEGYEIVSVTLGKVEVIAKDDQSTVRLETVLNKHGFELLADPSEALVERIKVFLIQELEKGNTDQILTQLPGEIGKTYSVISKAFSRSEGMTLEKYLINLKIEKVKEAIQLGQMNFSEIAYALDYKNSSHLAKQFRNHTGMSMSDYKKLQEWDRKELDKIV